jgi:hypothetical protein
MNKQFKELKPGDIIFLVGSPDFIAHEDLVENFSLFKIKSIIPTLDGKRNQIICLSGEYYSILTDMKEEKISYFTALQDIDIIGHQASIRIDEWSEKFTKTISYYQNFLCFPDVNSGLDYLEKRFDKYKKDIEESRKINDKALKENGN